MAALPGLALLFDSIINLANAIASFTPGQLLTIGLAFGVITLFVWGLAAALDLTAGEQVQWQLLDRSDLRLKRLAAPAPSRKVKK